MNTKILRSATSIATALIVVISGGAAANASSSIFGSSGFTFPGTVSPQPAPAPNPRAHDPELELNARLSAETVRLLNQHRAAKGLGNVVVDPHLTARSVEWSRHMRDVNRLYHSKDNVWENVLYNYNPAPDAAFHQWRKSPGHNANMLEPRVTRVGIGFARSADGRIYSTMQLL